MLRRPTGEPPNRGQPKVQGGLANARLGESLFRTFLDSCRFAAEVADLGGV